MIDNVEKQKYKDRAKKNLAIIVILFFALVATLLISISVGASSVNAIDVIKVLFEKLIKHSQITDMQRQVVLLIRLPRALAAIIAGMALSCAGLLMQGIFQNPLVSPYTLGVSNGAAFGAALAIVFGSSFGLAFSQYLIPVFAFVFAIATMVLVYAVSKMAKDNSKTLVLSGVAVGYLFSALVSSIKYISDVRELPELVYWTMGSLSGIPWIAIGIMAVVVAFCFIIMMRYAWDLNIMSSGEESAISLGVNYSRVRIVSFILCTLMTAVAVAFTGVIGFVGLIAPHIIRMIIGSDYRYTIPASALMGALLLLVSDTLARNIFAPTELPVGIVTSLIGVPFFLYLVSKKRRG